MNTKEKFRVLSVDKATLHAVIEFWNEEDEQGAQVHAIRHNVRLPLDRGGRNLLTGDALLQHLGEIFPRELLNEEKRKREGTLDVAEVEKMIGQEFVAVQPEKLPDVPPDFTADVL